MGPQVVDHQPHRRPHGLGRAARDVRGQDHVLQAGQPGGDVVRLALHHIEALEQDRIDIAPENLARLRDAGFEPVQAAGRAPLPEGRAAAIRAVLTNGSTGFSAAQIAALPALEIVCALGAGHEKIDLAAAAARGIAVTNGAGTNDVAVADHAMLLLLAIARGVVQADAAARRG